MSYPPRPDRYGPPPHDPRQARQSELLRDPGVRGFSFYAALVVAVLGVVGFFLGFAPYAKYASSTDGDLPGVAPSSSVNFFDNAGSGVGAAGLGFILAAAAIAAFSLLPGQRQNGPVVAGMSLAGSTMLLFLLVGLQPGLEAGVGLILVLVAACLQSALAIAGLLSSAGVIGGGDTIRGYQRPASLNSGRGFVPYGPSSGPPDHRGGPYRAR
jgi:hypothetical protein